jgi:putative DNA primase/helicase
LVWNGHFWRADRVAAEALAKRTIDSGYARLAEGSDREAKERLAHLRRSGQSQRITGMLHLARSEAPVGVRSHQLDADPWLLNAKNGTIDLRSGCLRKPSRTDLLTRAAPTAFEPDAPCPEWLAFLDHTFGRDAELIDYAARALGYTLVGGNPARVLFIPYGPPRTGKSTFLESVGHVLGEYARATTVRLLLATDNRAEHEAEIALSALVPPVRLVWSVETSEDQRFDAGRVNHITGDDTLSARRLYHGRIEFRPSFTPMIGTNHYPRVDDSSGAIWDRLRPVPFMNRLQEDEVDLGLRDRLHAEAVGIFAWLVRGCLAWQEHGLAAPGVAVESLREYRQAQRTTESYVDECLVWREGLWSSAADLYADYSGWCQREGVFRRSSTALGWALRARGAKPGKTSGQRGWLNVGLLDRAQEPLP